MVITAVAVAFISSKAFGVRARLGAVFCVKNKAATGRGVKETKHED